MQTFRLGSQLLIPIPHTVTPQEGKKPYIIFAKRVAIHRANLNGNGFDTLITNRSFTTNAIAIDFDARYLYTYLLCCIHSATPLNGTILNLWGIQILAMP